MLVWVIGLTITYVSPLYNLENTAWRAMVMETSGYFFIVIGNLIFNKVIQLKFLNKKIKCNN